MYANRRGKKKGRKGEGEMTFVASLQLLCVGCDFVRGKGRTTKREKKKRKGGERDEGGEPALCAAQPDVALLIGIDE